MADDHDQRYRHLFSHLGFVERLLTSFVCEEFARQESDVIWKLLVRDRPVYLYLLIEFQSSVDPLMALRFLRYLAELYASLVAEGQEPPLPADFPLLLYTGDSRWTAARSTDDMIRPEIPEAYIPQLTYYPILVNEIPTETLLPIHNAVAAVFYVENADPQKLAQTLDELMAILYGEAPELFEAFEQWLSNYLADTAGEAAVIEPIRSAREAKTMFAAKLKEYGERLKEEAREEGQQEVKRETAQALKEQGVDVAVIAKATGLSPEEVADL